MYLKNCLPSQFQNNASIEFVLLPSINRRVIYFLCLPFNIEILLLYGTHFDNDFQKNFKIKQKISVFLTNCEMCKKYSIFN